MPRKTPEDRFDLLMEAAAQAFIRQGYRRTQMADVARELGVATGTIYLYVESKEALFNAVLRHAAGVLASPTRFPIPTPEPGATLAELERRLVEEARLERLRAALERESVTDPRAELEGIVREIYQLMQRQRTAIKLVDSCSHDHPELAAVWFKLGREGLLGLLTSYLEKRTRQLLMPSLPDIGVAARLLLELIAFWAVHRYWDPSPQQIHDELAEETVIRFILGALTREENHEPLTR